MISNTNKLVRIAIITFSMLLVISFIASELYYSKDRSYQFRNKSIAEKCEFLLMEEHAGAILMGTTVSDGQYVAYVRDLVDSEDCIQMECFDSRQDMEKYIEAETISECEGIPPLNYDAEFTEEDGAYYVSYGLKYCTPDDVLLKMYEYLYMLIPAWILLNLLVAWYICRKNEKGE